MVADQSLLTSLQYGRNTVSIITVSGGEDTLQTRELETGAVYRALTFMAVCIDTVYDIITLILRVSASG